ncbi:hypothetical protein GCM10009551_012440 [Nocardiopsis tropica]
MENASSPVSSACATGAVTVSAMVTPTASAPSVSRGLFFIRNLTWGWERIDESVRRAGADGRGGPAVARPGGGRVAVTGGLTGSSCYQVREAGVCRLIGLSPYRLLSSQTSSWSGGAVAGRRRPGPPAPRPRRGGGFRRVVPAGLRLVQGVQLFVTGEGHADGPETPHHPGL